MQLADLIDGYKGALNPAITMITADSRKVTNGALFVALAGSKDNGDAYIADAVARGAAAILGGPDLRAPEGVAVINANNPRLALAQIAARFYPQRPRYLAAVTGTNGKTSTAIFTQQLWESLGLRGASLGTLGVHGTGIAQAGAMTTPDPVTLHALLSDLAGAGFDHAVMEASSHGLSQYRMDGLRVNAAGFTNLSRDHLDYHPTMQDYLDAKARLFTTILDEDGVAILNADIPEFKALREMTHRRVISYGAGGDVRLMQRQAMPHGQMMTVSLRGREHRFVLPLVGAFQAMNALCALGLVMAEAPDDLDRAAFLIEHLADLRGAAGRLQLVTGHPAGAAVYVDYAHTPDALDNVISALRPHTEGRLVCVFGCGGDRDAGKRPIMGHIAGTRADVAIVTDDNPRTEDAAKIRAAVMAGAQGRATEIGDRREAIFTAIAQLAEGDVLVLAGKGHEQGQIIGSTVHPFDDVAVANEAIAHLNKA